MDHRAASLPHWLPSWITIWLHSHYRYCHGTLSCYTAKTSMTNQSHKHMKSNSMCVWLFYVFTMPNRHISAHWWKLKTPKQKKQKTWYSDTAAVCVKKKLQLHLVNHNFIWPLAQTLRSDWPLGKSCLKDAPPHTFNPSFYVFLSFCPLISHKGVCMCVCAQMCMCIEGIWMEGLAKRSDDPQSSAPASTSIPIGFHLSHSTALRLFPINSSPP